jgi:hypothetical protein
MPKPLRLVLGLLVIGGIGIQFIRPERLNPSTKAGADLGSITQLPAQVRGILERSCYDCHSNATRWPWYSAVAPASWLVAGDVNEGREHMNFSEWGTYPAGRRISRLEMIATEVDKGSMPPAAYLLVHRSAALSPEDRNALLAWADAALDSLTGK